VPVGVTVWVCVARADPVKVSAGTVPPDPVKVSAGTVPADPVKVSAGTVCVCVARADPVKVSAGIVIEGELEAAAALFSVENTYFVGLVTGTSVEAEVIVVDPFVPAGVPALVAPVVVVPFVPAGVKLAVEFVPAGVKLAVEFVPAGVPALTAEVVSDAPVNVGVLTVPAGVIAEFPPVPPTSPFAATVPCRNCPFRAATSVKFVGQLPLRIISTTPDGIPCDQLCWLIHAVVGTWLWPNAPAPSNRKRQIASARFISSK
jgi:hypothetical protein